MKWSAPQAKWSGSVRWAQAAIVLTGLFLFPGRGAGQGFFRVSPGPLSAAHSKLEGATGCTNCHNLTSESGAACLGCHDHAGLKEAIEAKRGLHSTFNKPCFSCHKEHKGRDQHIANWQEVGGQAIFDHSRVGFTLAGAHKAAKCASCHKRKTSAGLTLFAGLHTQCAGCHKGVHKLVKSELREKCAICHRTGGISPKTFTPATLASFDHGAESHFALTGKHAQTRCVQCHTRGIASSPTARICSDCHKSPHGKTFRGKQCSTCHDPQSGWRGATFDHSQTGFPLEGRHATVSCSQCHKDPNSRPRKDCASCHKATHGKRFGQLQCLQCHAPGGGKTMVFDHGANTRFPLTARHAQLQCRNCHRGSTPTQFEKFPSPNCIDCHRHKSAHQGQFGSKPCTDCHLEGGSRKLVFDHDKDAPFPLEGVHKKVACAKCHPQNIFKTGWTKCVDCHGDKDPHKGRLGTECEKCHRPEKGAPKFSHESMTSFARTGKHEKIACGFCHRPKPAGGPPKVGWTRSKSPTALDPLSPWTRAPALDRRFPVMGKSCAECHADRHDGRNGAACQSCHNTRTFSDVSAAIHDTGPFRLIGVHQTLACQRCHSHKRLLAGMGESCELCHRDDDSHNNGLGPNCGDCHQQNDWRPARFSHMQTGFPLRGAHRSARCADCHGAGTFQGLPTECEVCHASNAARVLDPLHTPELRPCDRCHSENGFVPARASHPNFELRGRHLFVTCGNCHYRGTYAGTPDTCVSCHLSRYEDPSAQPNHRAAGYPMTCEDCHTPLGWRPARKP